jgi:uncharacterized protein
MNEGVVNGPVQELDFDGWSPLMLASIAGRVDEVAALLAAGEQSDEMSGLAKNEALLAHACRGGWTALTAAAHSGHLDIITMLLDRGARIDSSHNDCGSALAIALYSNHVDAANLLVSRGANIDFRFDDQSTILMRLIHRKNLPMTIYAIDDLGMDVNGHDENLDTPLIVAATYNQLEMVVHLLSQGAKVDHANVFDETCVSRAAMYGHALCLALLLDACAALGHAAMTQFEAMALFHAANEGSMDVLSYLIKKRQVNINFQSEDVDYGLCVTYVAVKNIEALRMVLEHGAHVDAVTYDDTALMRACDMLLVDSIKLLLQYKANADMKDRSGATALERVLSSFVPNDTKPNIVANEVASSSCH